MSILTDVKETEQGFQVKFLGGKFLGGRTYDGGKVFSDKYFTPRKAIIPLKILIEKFSENCTVFEPFAGEGAIVDVMEEWGFNVIAWDKEGKYAKENYDFTNCNEFPDYDIIITNPPWSIKFVVLDKLIRMKKPFIMLLPLLCLTTVKFKTITSASNCVIDVGIVTPSPTFEFEGKKIQVPPSAWMMFGGNNTGTSELMWLD